MDTCRKRTDSVQTYPSAHPQGSVQPGDPTRGDRFALVRSTRAFWFAAGALTLILLAVIPLVDNGFIALPDEGVYSAQASALASGSWGERRPAPDIDTDGNFDPVGATAIAGDIRIPYGRHPLYGLTLSMFFRIGGQAGMLVLSALGGVAAATLTGLIARELKPVYGIPALLLIGLGSPLLFNSVIVSAHNLGTAAGAVVVLSSIRLLRYRTRLAWPVLALSSLLVPFLRSEGSIFIGSVALAYALLSLGIPSRRNFRKRLLAIGLVAGVSSVIGYVADLWLTNLLYDFSDFRTHPLKAFTGEQSGPLKAAWIALIQPWNYGGDATVPALLVLGGTILGAITLRLLKGHQLLPFSLLFAASAASLWWQATDITLVTGLFSAMPVLAFALFWLRRSDATDPVAQLLTFVALIAIVLLLATIYSDGGAAQWGGRLIQILLPVLVPLTILGLHNAFRAVTRPQALFLAFCLGLTLTSTSIYSLRVNAASRSGAKSIAEDTSALVEQYRHGKSVTLLARGTSDGMARIFWNDDTKLNLLATPFSASYYLLKRADDAGYDGAIMITDAPDDALERADAKWFDEFPWQRSESVGVVPGLGSRVFVFSKPEG